MCFRGIALRLSIAAVSLLMAASAVDAQTPPVKSAAGGKARSVPHANGHPSLEGTWTNATVTPLERPKDLGAKQYFTAEEAAAYEKRSSDPDSHVEKSLRTSLVIDPPDGKVSPLTTEAQAKVLADKAYSSQHPADGPEDRNLGERCLVFSGVGPPMLPEPADNGYQILESPGYVTVLAEMNHDVRVVPIDGKVSIPNGVSQWHGISRGRWDGDTLVVETTNIRSIPNHYAFGHFGIIGFRANVNMWDENLRVTERFTRMDADTITYRATVDDPTVYTKPWTIEEFLTKTTGPILESACHEGNYDMANILQTARVAEEAAKSKK